MPKEAIDSIIKSGVIAHSGINSWTTSKETAKNFGGDAVVLVMKKPSVGWVNQGNQAEEDEVIRPPSSLKITKVVRTKKGTVIEVEEDEDYK